MSNIPYPWREMTVEVASREIAGKSYEDIFRDPLLDLMRAAQERAAPNAVWHVSPRMRRMLRKRYLPIRQAWPRKGAYRRSVHRAYRTLGVFP